MAVGDDIKAQKQSALHIIAVQLLAEAARANNNVPGAQGKVEALEAQRTELELQDYVGATTNAAMAAALKAMQDATASMNTTAAKMTTVTGFITHADDLISGAQGVVTALQGATG
jgi:hypothetical protein